VEALGYLGGVIAIVAGVVAVDQLWPGIPTGAELAFAAAGTVALGAVAALMRTDGEPALGRLRSVLWLLSTVSLVAFMGVLAAQVWDLSPARATLVAAGVATPYAALLWWRTRAPLQHLATFAGAAVVTGSGIASLAPGLGAWLPGLGVWVLSLAWGVAAHLGYLPPRDTGYLAAGIGLVVGAQMTMQEAAGYVIAVVTVAGLLAAGVVLRRVWVLALVPWMSCSWCRRCEAGTCSVRRSAVRRLLRRPGPAGRGAVAREGPPEAQGPVRPALAQVMWPDA
jgi:hypothetical protein